ncbi:hypothetical protein LEP1GSC194_3986 [Leptospira alstonii serovar Sichuan str. 79601]|uniref:Uncharacterized protein n=1 Tax=Leptospira alstonii serovar Sichuan str. 79601 TaxID=1218565 RepID=M6CZF9_9LEPT|nr:hypothetical protein LEP1GSC194_3986 [Leptospira alstonii serovar Sichuan str. 79601]
MFYMYDWIPSHELNTLDLSELEYLEQNLVDECERLEKEFNVFFAVYKKGTLAKPKGLCTTFKFAKLDQDTCNLIDDFEHKLGKRILVAYAKPLERW